MKTLILYATKYGATEKALKLLKEELKGNVDMVDLKTASYGDLKNYDTILFGGSIYIGKVQEEVKKCIENHKEVLLNKNIALLLCCKDTGEKFNEIMKINFPEWAVQKAFMTEILGHEINLEKMNFFERFLLKNIFKVKKSYSAINHQDIKKIANRINEVDVVKG